MRIAVIGTGISGNVAARHLCREHDVTVFEAAGHVGGHTHTHDITWRGEKHAIDTGFIVFNDWTYPNFIALLEEIGAAALPTEMSFSSRCEASGIEYNGASLNKLFSQRRNLLRPAFHAMIRDILRFNRESRELINHGDEGLTLGSYLAENNYGRMFVNNYIIPMGAAIWSTDPQQMLDFPAGHFVRFFANHGLLNIKDRPQWRVIAGGSREYVEKLVAPFRERIRLNEAVLAISRAIGRRAAMEMLLTGRYFSAQEAKQLGLVNRVVSLENLNDETETLANQIAEASRFVLSIGKQGFYAQVDQSDSNAMHYAKHTITMNLKAIDAQNGIKAFLNKEACVWQNC